MLKKDPNYTRLKKLGGRANTGSAYYWLGLDHLLVVEVSSYNERYRRFYFRDIQAVVVQRNRHRMVGNIIGGVVAVVPAGGMGALLNLGEYVGAAVCGGILFVIGLAMVVNSVRGPNCAVHIRTAVQTQKLAGITRWNRAELMIETITPLIQSAQPITDKTASASAASADFTAEPETP